MPDKCMSECMSVCLCVCACVSLFSHSLHDPIKNVTKTVRVMGKQSTMQTLSHFQITGKLKVKPMRWVTGWLSG